MPTGSPARTNAKLTTVGSLGDDAWRAIDSSIGDCVLMLLDPDELARRRRALRKLNSPHLRREVSVVAVPDHGPGLVTTFLPGSPLSMLDLGRRADGPREALRIGLGLLEVLAHAHERGVVHGRLASRHVIVGESVGLVGFGQAPAGTTEANDFGAVAAILYEQITGEEWTSWAPRASYFRPALGRAFDDWLATLTDPERGFRNATEMKSALRAVAGTMPPPPPAS